MKTLLISYKFLFMTLIVLSLAMCSSDNNSETETPDPIDDDNEGSSSDTTPSNDIGTLWIGNFTRATKEQYLAMLKGRKMPQRGNVIYRQNLGLKDELAIFSVSGGSYNKDDSFPKNKEDAYSPYNSFDVERNNVTISFVFVDEAQANAELTINEPMTFATGSLTIPAENNSVRSIEKGSFTIKVKDARLNDDIPPLGKDEDNKVFTSFKFNDEDIADVEVNGLKYGTKNTNPTNISHAEFVDMFNEQDNILPIKIIETAIVQGGKRLDLVEPPNF